MAPNWSRLIRFIAEEDGQVHLGEVDGGRDIGLALLNKETVTAKLVTGSIFDGTVTEKQLHVSQVNYSQKVSRSTGGVLTAPSFCRLSRWRTSRLSDAWG